MDFNNIATSDDHDEIKIEVVQVSHLQLYSITLIFYATIPNLQVSRPTAIIIINTNTTIPQSHDYMRCSDDFLQLD